MIDPVVLTALGEIDIRLAALEGRVTAQEGAIIHQGRLITGESSSTYTDAEEYPLPPGGCTIEPGRRQVAIGEKVLATDRFWNVWNEWQSVEDSWHEEETVGPNDFISRGEVMSRR